MKGFTLLEVLLVIATITVLAGIGIPVYTSLQIKNDLDVATSTSLQSIRRAQMLSQSVDGDTTWGVKIQSASITLFKGSSYGGRDTNYDEVYSLSGSVTPTGITELVFSKLLGTPNTTGTLTLTNTNNEVQSITIGSKGQLDY